MHVRLYGEDTHPHTLRKNKQSRLSPQPTADLLNRRLKQIKGGCSSQVSITGVEQSGVT